MPFHFSSILIQQIIQIIVIPALPPGDRNPLLLLLVLGNGTKQLLEALLGHLVLQLAGAGERDQPVLDAGGALLLHQLDAAQPLGRLRRQDLRQQRLPQLRVAVALLLRVVAARSAAAAAAAAAAALLLPELLEPGAADLWRV